ncbi:Microtubule-associated protein 1A [Linum perenne]
MTSSRVVLNSNNLWLAAWTDRTISVLDPGMDLNIHNVPNTRRLLWRTVGRVGSNPRSTHRELEVSGVVFSGKKLEELSTHIINHQIIVNREGLMIMHFNVGAPHMYLQLSDNKPSVSLIRRLNDIFDWSKYGVEIHTPMDTVWDRFQLNTGRLMVANKNEKLNQISLLEEKDREIQRLNEQLKEKDDQLIKRNNELVEAKKKCEESEKGRRLETEELNEQLKKKDDQLQDKKSELTETKKQYEEKRNENEKWDEKMKEQLKEKDDLIQEQKMELAEIKKQLEEMQKENEKLKEQSDENGNWMTQLLKEKDDQIENLNKMVEEMQNKLNLNNQRLEEENQKLDKDDKKNDVVSSINIAIRIIV